MIGCFIAGGLAVFALSRALHHRRFCGGGGWRRGYGGCHSRWGGGGGGWGGPGPRFGGEFDGGGYGPPDPWSDDVGPGGWELHRGGNWGRRFFIRRVVEHVRATPEQERRIGEALSEFRDEVTKLGNGEARKSRQEIADAFRRPTFDGVVLGEQFARHDTVLEGGRKAFVGLVAKIHDTLEPEQRTWLAALLEKGPRFGWWARGF